MPFVTVLVENCSYFYTLQGNGSSEKEAARRIIAVTRSAGFPDDDDDEPAPRRRRAAAPAAVATPAAAALVPEEEPPAATAQAIAEAGINMRGLSGTALGRRCAIYLAFDNGADLEKARRILKKALAGK